MTGLKYVLLVSVAVSALSACTSSSDRTDDQTCTGTFDFSPPHAEPLGSNQRFDAALREAAKGADGATLIEITRTAGWADGWERLVEVRASTEVDDLNKNANTPGQCWKHLPTMDYREGPEQGYYLFVDKGKPVQVVSWSGDRKPLEVRDRGALTAESLLVPRPGHDRLEPAP
ncbi:hypothetical protein [Nocardia anaemiae]|uniref:hypothetical protein n=1 Tax=Nocardia anaemiae TaxID=263910 RepID=UPI0007A380DF|nr:hypothetical protein [Nocardia anaemiae]